MMTALYHLHAKLFKRSEGADMRGKASYRSSSMLTNFKTGQIFDYRRKKGTTHTEILAPPNVPDWVRNRNILWNTIEEEVVLRKDGQLARELEAALPKQLPHDDCVRLVQSFTQEELVALGMVADIAIHEKDADDPVAVDGKYYHVHIILTLNSVGPSGFGKKNRDWNSKALLVHLREAWANYCNDALKAAGSASRVDHRTLKAQRLEALKNGDLEKAKELNRRPQPKVGVKGWHMARRGLLTPRYLRWRAVIRLNLKRIASVITRSPVIQPINDLITRNKLKGPKT